MRRLVVHAVPFLLAALPAAAQTPPAALIAAAPDLLIACRAMLECQANLCESCIRLARAAISKAESG